MSREPTPASWLWEFSKRVVIACAIFWALAQIYAMAAMAAAGDFSALPTLIDAAERVMETCVFGYMIKAGVENVGKIVTSQIFGGLSPRAAVKKEDRE